MNSHQLGRQATLLSGWQDVVDDIEWRWSVGDPLISDSVVVVVFGDSDFLLGLRAGGYVGDEVVAVEPSPAFLGAVESPRKQT